jgi:hypothetical protein
MMPMRNSSESGFGQQKALTSLKTRRELVESIDFSFPINTQKRRYIFDQVMVGYSGE